MITQNEIVGELKAQCAEVVNLPVLGWHFVYGKRHMVYVPNRDCGIIRICVPFVANACEFDAYRLATAVNVTNREVRYAKVVILDNGSVSINYDHRCAADDDAHNIVAHILKALCFAADYLNGKLVGRK